MLSNAAIGAMLREIALRLDMEGVAFKPRAIEKAAYAVEAVAEPLDSIYASGGIKALEAIPGVGHGIAKRIEEALKTGSMSDLVLLRRKVPADVVALSAVEGVGPKKIKALYEALEIKTVADLAAAAGAGKIRNLDGFGEKSEEKIKKAIGFLAQSAGRLPLGLALEYGRSIEGRMRAVKGVRRVELAGSLRRRKETIGDIDVLVTAENPEKVMDAFVSMPEVKHVHAKGETKSMVLLSAGIDADLRVVPPESFGAALQYFTGSKDHNVVLRKIAQDRGLKLNEYGVFRGEKLLAGDTEESIYKTLGLPLIPAELREDRGEIQAAREGRLPRLVERGDLRGDLQTQTNWTDGANTIEEMAEAARKIGLEYIAITDHTRDLAMVGGSDEAKLAKQMEAIRALNANKPGIRVLTGAEVNLRKDGTLDVSDEMLAKLDVVGVGLHSLFTLPRDEQTRRILRAVENPNVDILFHPTARAFGKRPPVEFDFDAVVQAAARAGTALEIDAHPERLDLNDELAKKAVAAGVKLVIDSDAHSTADLRYPEDLGISVARRAWAAKGDILNTRPVAEFLQALQRKRASERS